MKKFRICNVEKNSPAAKAGIKAGEYLINVNGADIIDVFDYKFNIYDKYVTIGIEDKSGNIRNIEIEKEEYEDIGLEFETFLMDKPKACSNKCIFCFIDQLPLKMRNTLYFKDDDIRLSFLNGNYVTLTNCKDEDLERIIKYRMTPINVSVHTTNPELRVRMLGNKSSGNIMRQLEKLSGAGISINCQIVLCRGINDGQELDRTISDLTSLFPSMNSISVVPVGLTKHREGKYPLESFDSKSSKEVIEQISKHQEHNIRKYNSRIVFPADEFFIMAGIDMPGYKYYEDFPQIENGVGLMASFLHEFYGSLRRRKKRPDLKRKVNIVTGKLASDMINGCVKELKQYFPGLEAKVHVITNNFFGENITVAGLITGRDIVRQMKGKIEGEIILIPDVMLKHGTDLFLDDYTIGTVERELGAKVVAVGKSGRDFLQKLIAGK